MIQENSADSHDTVIRVLLANHRRFLAFLRSRVGSAQVAEEILQDAFVRSLEKAKKIRHSENAVAWFYRLLRNAVVDYFRRKASTHRSLEAFAKQLVDSNGELDSELHGVVCKCVTELIPVLKPEYGELITKVDLEGSDVSSAARSLGISAGNARVRLHRARTALRQEVERTCRTCAVHGCIDCSCGQKQ